MKRLVRTSVLLVGVVAALLIGAHWVIKGRASLSPPALAQTFDDPVRLEGTAHYWRQSVRFSHGGITLAYLRGTPEELGQAHSTLLRDDMLEIEGKLYRQFEERVPTTLGRALLLDAAQLLFRSVDENFEGPRLREIAASARGFQPDPFTGLFATYQRFVYLNALYDISLAFEESPLLGCTTFALGAEPQGEPLLARVFDFEVDPIFDEKKAVLLIAEDGKIPLASVAWGGLIGVVTGMNVEGLAAVVHGARAGEPEVRGEPVVQSLRRVLSETRRVDEAIAALEARPTMVSHLVILADAEGQAAVVERVPKQPAEVRWLKGNSVVTNHFEGRHAADERNQRIRARTSTVARRARGEELVVELSPAPSLDDAIGLLRDRSAPEGQPLRLGQREAINGLIAAHGVVFDLKRRTLWVSEPPHLLGRFVAFDLRELTRVLPRSLPEPPDSRPSDALLHSGAFEAWKRAGSKHE